jgi:hypothetical protein
MIFRLFRLKVSFIIPPHELIISSSLDSDHRDLSNIIAGVSLFLV